MGVTRRAVRGSAAAIRAPVVTTQSGTDATTAYIERLNATFRAGLAPLVRRGRAIARTEARLSAGRWLVGSVSNVCWVHESLRQPAPPGTPRKWGGRTPAMAAGLTDHVWTMEELLNYRIPPPPGAAPKRRGRPPKRVPLPAALSAAS